jgi:excisionase family DNA binding protein
MAKKPSPARIKKHRIYTTWEAAEALGLHRKTIVRWIKNHGLQAEQTRKPWLIDGAGLKAFLEARRGKDKARLASGEVYCLPCRAARVPAERMAEFQMQSQTKGVLSGICPVCDRLMHRFLRRADLDAMRTILDVTLRPAVTGIVGVEDPAASVPYKQARQTHG